jgi:hypothetical protein
MGQDVYRSIEYARALLENLENLLRSEEGVRASEVRGRLQRFEACVRELGESVEEWLREDCNELLQRVGARLENLQRYRPEEYLSVSEREEILDKEIPYWRGTLKAITAASRWGFLRTLLELLKRESERGELNWPQVFERLVELRGYFKTLEQTYSSCVYAQNLSVGFEAYLEEVKAKSGKLSQSDRDRLVGLCEEWRENVRTVLYSCRLPPPPPPPPPPPGVMQLYFEIASERYSVEASRRRRLVVGRYDPGGLDPVIQGAAPDGLKILEGRSVLYVFNSVECRWGCIEPDRDCTHREHVEVEVEEGAAAVRMAEGAVLPVYYGFAPEERKLLGRTDTLFLKPGQRLYLWISGVYLDARRKREQAPLLLSLESRRGRVTVRPA